MAKTRKSIQLKNLARYDVLIEDTQQSSAYFQVTNLPTEFTGGRNSFLLAGSSALKPGSDIQIEILDAAGLTIFQNPVRGYTEGQSKLISVEVTDTTAPGFATIILLGRADVFSNGAPIPANWKNSYNVRWTTRILVESTRRNTSPLILEDQPEVIAEERRFFNVDTSTYTTYQVPITASLSPILYSSFQIGYLLQAQAPTTFSADYRDSYLTGSLTIDGDYASVYIPISGVHGHIFKSTTAFSTGHLIKTENGEIIRTLLLRSGSYQTEMLGRTVAVTSSVLLEYRKLNAQDIGIPISYAKLRVTKMRTVSGEIHKLRVSSKVSTNTADYNLITDSPVITSELLVSESIQGDIPIGNFTLSPAVTASWYADTLQTNGSILYPVSGSSQYYTPITGSLPVQITDDVLLRSMRADVPITGNQFAGTVSQSGYFIGTINPVLLYPDTEYTLELDAVYCQSSGSVNLIGNAPSVDIYIVGVDGSVIFDNNPLGQKIGTLSVVPGACGQRYEQKHIDFTPNLPTVGEDDRINDSHFYWEASVIAAVGIRFVVNNGFWYFSNISLKPSSDKLFAPDEVTILVPNYEHYNELLQHRVEFVDINNNSTLISAETEPSFFTGSNVDLGVLP